MVIRFVLYKFDSTTDELSLEHLLIMISHSPIPLPANELGWASCVSSETTLNDARGVEPGCVEIMPRKRVTFHVRTWLYSEQMDTRFFSLSITFTTGFRWTMNVWKSCGPWPTVSGCCTITRTVPELVPYAISIQFPLRPEKNKIHRLFKTCGRYRIVHETLLFNTF